MHAPANKKKSKNKKPPKTAQQIAQEKYAKKEADRLMGPKKGFYDKAEDMVTDARSTATTPKALKRKADAIAQVNDFQTIATDPTFKEQMGRRVRQPAKKKQKTSPFGVGKDEPLQTSKTPEIIQQSAGLLPGKDATFPITLGGKQQEMDLLRVQQELRPPTDSIVFEDGSGHPGALKETKKSKGFITSSSPAFHKERTRRGLHGSNKPRNQVGRSLIHNVQGTANHQQLAKFKKGITSDGLDLSKQADLLKYKRKHIVHRNKKKQDVLDFQAATRIGGKSPPGSPLFQPSSGPLIPPLSPMIDPDTDQPMPQHIPNPYGSFLTFKQNDNL